MKKKKSADFTGLTKKVLMYSDSPCAVLTDEKATLLFVYGDTVQYLTQQPGKASLNVIEMAISGIKTELKRVINNAVKTRKKVISPVIGLKTKTGLLAVRISIMPFAEAGTGKKYLIISFHEKGDSMEDSAGTKYTIGKIDSQAREYLYSKNNFKKIIEEIQNSNEQLKSSNEELQSMNEELQSTNEELETSKEEQQSVNEELTTVNAELQSKIEQLSEMQNDMKNILDNVNLGIIFLDENLKIKRFNKEAIQAYHLVHTDIGRPLGDIKSYFDKEDLILHARTVLESLVPVEKEIQSLDGSRFMVRIIPYRTVDNVIEGIVLTFNNLTDRKIR